VFNGVVYFSRAAFNGAADFVDNQIKGNIIFLDVVLKEQERVAFNRDLLKSHLSTWT